MGGNPVLLPTFKGDGLQPGVTLDDTARSTTGWKAWTDCAPSTYKIPEPRKAVEQRVDAYLAALALEHNCTYITADS